MTPQKAMGYGLSGSYGLSSLSRLAKGQNLWAIRGYGLSDGMGYEGFDCNA